MTKQCKRCKRNRRIVARNLCKPCYDAARHQKTIGRFPGQPRLPRTQGQIAAQLGVSVATIRVALRDGRLKLAADGTVTHWAGLKKAPGGCRVEPSRACQRCGRPLTNAKARRCTRCKTAELFRDWEYANG